MRKYKKLFYGILSFFITFILLLIFFSVNHLIDRDVVIKGDVFAQFFPLLNYLKGIFNGSNSIFYSFYKNLGGTMYGTFFYYLSSPFNLFVKFISSKDFSLFFIWLSIIKMSFCSVSMYLYMTYRHKKCNLIILMFSICYGLMGYNLNFFSNIMWLDVVILSPIVLIGLNKLIRGESPILYIISLFFSILFNYYISYMLCLFCVLYFVYVILLSDFNKKQIIDVIKRFIFISLFTGLMCSFFLIPCFFESKNYLRTLNLSDIFSFDLNFFNVFSKTFIGSANFKDLINFSSINLYCSIFVMFLVYLFLVNRKISKKKRRITLLFIIFMILPCFIFPLNYVWHLFSSPYFCNYRYSFLLCFFFLNIAYESYCNLSINKSTFMLFFLFYLSVSIYFFVISFTYYYDFLGLENLLFTLLFIVVYYLILKFKRNDIIVCFTLLIELILNLFLIFKDPIVFSELQIVNNDYINIVDKYSDSRMEFVDYLTFNDSILMEYYGIGNFLSTNNGRVMRFFSQMSLREKYDKQNYYHYGNEQYILDSIVGLKYVISHYEIDGYKIVDKFSIDGFDMFVYENPNYMGIGYIVNDYCNSIEYGFNYDEKVFNCINGSDYHFYRKYSVLHENNEYSSIIKNPSNFYLYYPGFIDANIDFEDRLKASIVSYSDDYAYFKNDKKDFEFKFSVDDVAEQIGVYYFDFDRFKSAFKSIDREIFNYEIIGNKIHGTINTDGGILMITIPYEKGFVIKVDGKEVQYKEVLDTFIGIDLDKGYHDITIEYFQPYLREGCIVSFISFLALLVFCKKKY